MRISYDNDEYIINLGLNDLECSCTWLGLPNEPPNHDFVNSILLKLDKLSLLNFISNLIVDILPS